MSILSEREDGHGYFYGRMPDDHRQINVRRGPVDLLWRAWVGGERVGDHETGVWESKGDAEAAAIEWLKSNPDHHGGEDERVEDN